LSASPVTRAVFLAVRRIRSTGQRGRIIIWCVRRRNRFDGGGGAAAVDDDEDSDETRPFGEGASDRAESTHRGVGRASGDNRIRHRRAGGCCCRSSKRHGGHTCDDAGRLYVAAMLSCLCFQKKKLSPCVPPHGRPFFLGRFSAATGGRGEAAIIVSAAAAQGRLP
jgi:hypothetical protein